jgi:hypothetical protein
VEGLEKRKGDGDEEKGRTSFVLQEASEVCVKVEENQEDVSLLKCRGVYFAQSLVQQNMTFVSLTVIGEEASDCYRLCDPTWNIGRGDVRLGVIIG